MRRFIIYIVCVVSLIFCSGCLRLAKIFDYYDTNLWEEYNIVNDTQVPLYFITRLGRGGHLNGSEQRIEIVQPGDTCVFLRDLETTSLFQNTLDPYYAVGRGDELYSNYYWIEIRDSNDNLICRHFKKFASDYDYPEDYELDPFFRRENWEEGEKIYSYDANKDREPNVTLYYYRLSREFEAE